MIPLQIADGVNALTIVSVTVNLTIIPASEFYHNFVIKPLTRSVENLVLKDQSHDARITSIREEIIRKEAQIEAIQKEIDTKNNMTAMLKETLEALPKFKEV